MAKRQDPKRVGASATVNAQAKRRPPRPTDDDSPRDEKILDGGGPRETAETKAERARRDKVTAFIKDSLEEWRTSENAEHDLKEEMRIDQAFEAGAQWDEEIENERNEDDRPVLKINRLPQFKRQVANQLARAKTAIQINPQNDDADRDTAEVLQGVCRNIENGSEAETQYSNVCLDQLVIGRGWLQVKNEFAVNDSFKQVIKIKHIRNPFSVYPDPTIQEFDYTDMRHCHIVRDVPNREYDRKWGHLSPRAGIQAMQGDSDLKDWMPEGKTRVAERYYLDYETRTLLQLEDGTEIWEDIYTELQDEIEELLAQAPTPNATAPPTPGMPPTAGAPPPVELPKPLQRREVHIPTVRWALHNAIDILEGNDERDAGRRLPGTRIPVVPVIGDMRDLDGTLDFRGMVRDARDPQRMYNFWASSIAETVTLAPKAPWVVAEGQIEGYEDLWEEANTKTYSTLPYKPTTVDGLNVPPPQRQVAEPPIQAMVMGLKEADNDLKAVMGLFDPSLGQAGPEQSGKAILARQRQGDIANSNYQDNRDRAVRAIGRILLEWIPEIMDVARIEHIVFGDNSKKAVMIHANQPDSVPSALPPGIEKVFDLSVGRYNVDVSSGPSYDSKRQEAEAWMIELYKAAPQLMAATIDIFLENSDSPVAQQMAKRAKKMLPPNLADDDDPNAELIKAKGMLQQIQQQHTMMVAALNKANDMLKSQKVQTDGRILIAMIQAQAQLTMAAAKIGSAGDIQMFQAEFQRMTQVMDHVHERIGQEMDHQSAVDQQQLQLAAAPPDAAGAPAPAPAA